MSGQKKLVVSFSSSIVHENCMGLVNFKEIINEHSDLNFTLYEVTVVDGVVMPHYIVCDSPTATFKKGHNTDIGYLDFGGYSVIYSKYLEDCNGHEIMLIVQKGEYTEILKEYAKICGFSELEIDLMCYFKDFNVGLLKFNPRFKNGGKVSFNYIDENYSFHKTKKNIKPEQKYFKVKGGYYTININMYRLIASSNSDYNLKVITDDYFIKPF